MKAELIIQRGIFSSWVCGYQFNGELYVRGKKAIRFSFPWLSCYEKEGRMIAKFMATSLREHYRDVPPDGIVSAKNSNCDKSLYGTKLIGPDNPENAANYFFLMKVDMNEKEFMMFQKHHSRLASLVSIRNKMRRRGITKIHE